MSRFTPQSTKPCPKPERASASCLNGEGTDMIEPQKTQCLSPQDEQRIQSLMQRLESCEITQILRYGQKLQTRIATITEQTLEAAVKRDAGAVLDLLQTLNDSLQSRDESSRQTDAGFFRVAKVNTNLQSQYFKIAETLDRAKVELEGRRLALQVDTKMLEDTYDQLAECHKQLTLRIMAGERLLEQTLGADANQPVMPQNSEIVNHEAVIADDRAQQKRERLERRLLDLKTSQTLCLQLLTQVYARIATTEVLASNTQAIADEMIPAWQQNLMTALAMQDLKQTMRLGNKNLQHAITSTLDAYAELDNKAAGKGDNKAGV